MRAPTCPSCESAIDHCHGTLIVHLGRTVECTDTDCIDLDHARHAFVVDCGDIAGGCACAARDVTRTSRSARK
ncbi:hypothetical protein [Nocardia anaemiae]|uniref:hypothetical protein n=1 Tax=Nocardia anaemiae TaxID=263910 RepID=UPI0009FC46EB|nr:hypothetical protein [Nocardia anaemiae]